jgi:hypothetical protein
VCRSFWQRSTRSTSHTMFGCCAACVARRTQRAQKGSCSRASALNDPREWSVDGCRRDSVSLGAAKLQRRVKNRPGARTMGGETPTTRRAIILKMQKGERKNIVARLSYYVVCVAGTVASLFGHRSPKPHISRERSSVTLVRAFESLALSVYFVC